jgi:hypothetical protein
MRVLILTMALVMISAAAMAELQCTEYGMTPGDPPVDPDAVIYNKICENCHIVIRDPATGIVLHEQWREHGEPHRDGGPARIERNLKTGVATSEAWYKNGK